MYAGVPPLYKITTSKGYKYLKNDAALQEYQTQNAGKKYSVNRMKGLGEMDPEELEETVVDPEARIIVLKDLCAGTTPENHENALKAMKQCQIDIE